MGDQSMAQEATTPVSSVVVKVAIAGQVMTLVCASHDSVGEAGRGTGGRGGSVLVRDGKRCGKGTGHYNV